MSLKNELDQLLVNGKVEKAIDLLIEKVKGKDTDAYNTLILLKARYSANEKDNNLGIISRSDYQRSKNQIVYAFQQTMDGIPKNVMENTLTEVQIYDLNPPKFHNQKETEGNQQLFDMLVGKKMFLEKELITTYDSEKKFALQQNINDLNIQIQDFKNKFEVKKIITNQKIESLIGFDVKELITREVKKGVVLYHVPSKMQIKVKNICLIRIAFDKEILLQNLPASVKEYDIRENIRLSDNNRIEVTFEANEYFNIQSVNKPIQGILEGDYTEWQFHVTPLALGSYNLIFKINIFILDSEGKLEKQTTLTESVEVVTYEVPDAFLVSYKTGDLTDTGSDKHQEKRKIRIFVSYSSRDRELRELLIEGLRQHLYQSIDYEFELWTDRQIDIGSDWKQAIESAMDNSNAALLLVSAGFAASGFINREELAEFFKLKKDNNFLIMPVLVREYDFNQFEILSSLNFFKTYMSEYGFNKPIERNKFMPFDKLAENEDATEAQLNTYYKNLADFIRNAVANKFK